MIQFIIKFINFLLLPFRLSKKLFKITFNPRAHNERKVLPMTMSRADMKELVEEIVRKAIAEQARELEKHLNDIDSRLQEVEKRTRPR
jgi:ferritin-like protein